MVDFDDVRRAAERLRGRVRRTPTMRALVPTPGGEVEVVLKLEQTQLSGTFKDRGMVNALLRAKETDRLPAAGVVIASGGNAGIAVAIAGRTLGVPVTVTTARDVAAVKVQRIRSLGATVLDHFVDHPTSNTEADKLAERTGAMRLHAFDHPDVVTGAGTLLLEAQEQEPGLNAVLVSVGGGGLLAGTLLAGQPSDIRTAAVEPVGAPTLHAALAAGEPVDITADTIAKDSLGAGRIGTVPWQVCRDADLESVLVTDDAIVTAQHYLWDTYRLLVEPSAACPVAAVMTGAYRPGAGELPLFVLCGANVTSPF
ncbi:MAG TPA: serine/threonine dehydratase [Candidatus Ruania gallistercoris]|uniref:Serine/threonine dehydratase n=1 Tax=Candidatus Ruania gallistercoris TaxID=2838746 RepID=A0A9D2J3V7_9MICO|nr:serine/threonine dehydratase [Candidatus Ruania gallistercoris]